MLLFRINRYFGAAGGVAGAWFVGGFWIAAGGVCAVAGGFAAVTGVTGTTTGFVRTDEAIQADVAGSSAAASSTRTFDHVGRVNRSANPASRDRKRSGSGEPDKLGRR